jgi:subtilisin family serine protease
MQTNVPRSLILLALSLFALSSVSVLARPALQSAADRQPHVAADVRQTLQSAGRARVLISLRLPAAGQSLPPDPQRRTAIGAAQRSVLDQLSPADFQLGHRYITIPGLAGVITDDGLAALEAQPLVERVDLDLPGGGSLTESVAALGANTVHSSYNITGAGVTVAVLDSGVDTDHPDLSDDIIAQHCFTANDCPPANTAESGSAEDEHGHGTHVASIITSRGAVSAPGFAPDAKIVAVRVLNASNGGFLSDWTAGMDWVYANRAALKVNVLNMSLGSNATYTSACDAAQPLMAAAVNNLVGAGVTVFAASGNAGLSNALSAPACIRNVVAVGATYDSNLGREPDSGTYGPGCFDAATSLTTITCYTNSNADLDVLAPGSRITAAGLGGGVATFNGTSMASPTAAGVAALLKQADPWLTPVQIEAYLKATGTPVLDARNGRQFPLINALQAVNAVRSRRHSFMPLVTR